MQWTALAVWILFPSKLLGKREGSPGRSWGLVHKQTPGENEHVREATMGKLSSRDSGAVAGLILTGRGRWSGQQNHRSCSRIDPERLQLARRAGESPTMQQSQSDGSQWRDPIVQSETNSNQVFGKLEAGLWALRVERDLWDPLVWCSIFSVSCLVNLCWRLFTTGRLVPLACLFPMY